MMAAADRMDLAKIVSEVASRCFGIQYILISLVVLIPVLWRAYTYSPWFHYQCKMVLYVAGIFLSSFIVIPMALLDMKSFRDPDKTRTVAGWSFMHLLRIKEVFGITTVQRGLENFKIPGDGPYVIVSNHQSSLDLIPMFDVLPERCTGLGKKTLLLAGPFGFASWLCGGIFVDRRPGKARGTMDGTVNELKEKKMRIWIFAEGTRNHGSGLLPFKKGAFHIALQAKIPIIPVVISSYANFYHKKSLRFEPRGKMIITVLPPVSTEPFTTETIDALVDLTRSQMIRVFERTSKEIDPNFQLISYDAK